MMTTDEAVALLKAVKPPQDSPWVVVHVDDLRVVLDALTELQRKVAATAAVLEDIEAEARKAEEHERRIQEANSMGRWSIAKDDHW